MPPNESLKPFRILIRAPNWLGDSVISIPAVRAIKSGRPDAHITVAAPEKIAPVWKLVAGSGRGPADSAEIVAWQHRRFLKQQNPFDAAVLFPNSLRIALEALAGAHPATSWIPRTSSQLAVESDHSRTREAGSVEHQAIRYLRIAQGSRREHRRAERRASAASKFPRTTNRASRATAQAKIGLCPGAEYGPAKRWLPERFAETAQSVSENRTSIGSSSGQPKTPPISETIAKALGEKCTNRTGKTSIEDLIAELRECRLLLTNDTGTMHLATLLGVPVVAVFGSTEPRLTGPLGKATSSFGIRSNAVPVFCANVRSIFAA